ncbi:hypothetical protein WKW50_05550 [Ochrobactrum sp. GPK 3]
MAAFTQIGRIVLAEALLGMDMFLAVGIGDLAWDNEAPPSTPEEQAIRDAMLSGLTGLTDMVGLTRVRDKFFVKPDQNGTIPMSDGAVYAQSTEPTSMVYARFQLDLADANVTLRESGIFVGSQIAESVPAGQMYIPLADVVSVGRIIQADRYPAIVRDGSLSQTFSTVLTM